MAAEIVPNHPNRLIALEGKVFIRHTAAAQMAKGTQSQEWKEKQPAMMATERRKRRNDQWNRDTSTCSGRR